MKRFAIHYDQNGRPNVGSKLKTVFLFCSGGGCICSLTLFCDMMIQGSAEVVYMRRSDAFQAMKRYNNVLLDGRSMRLEIVGGGNTEAAPPVAGGRVNVTGLNGRVKRTVSVRGGRGGGGRGRSAAPSVRRLPM